MSNILVLNRWAQYDDGERWDNSLANPAALIPHDLHRVTYVCDAAGARGVPAGADVHLVEDFGDVESVLDLCGTLVGSRGPFDLLIAFSEYLLDVAAAVRERYGIPGPRPHEVDRVRDKTVMKRVLQSAGIRVPRWLACESAAQVLARAPELGFPLILKPVRGASSQGVLRIADAGELAAVCGEQPLDAYEAEEFIDGELLHADGVVDANGTCLFLAVSRYVASCLDFECGVPLGSIIQTGASLRAACRDFTLRVLAALELKASAFHLEFFDTGRELVFLEIGARVPGADVSYVVHDVYGVNLFRLWVDVLVGRPTGPLPEDARGSGGWLMIPRPQPLPQVVVDSTPLVGKVPFLYRELVPRPGQVLEHASGYANLQGGRFLFRGGTEREIENAMHTVRSQYRLTTTPG